MESSRWAVAGSVAPPCSGALEACQVPGSVSFLADLSLYCSEQCDSIHLIVRVCHAMPLTFYSFYSFLGR